MSMVLDQGQGTSDSKYFLTLWNISGGGTMAERVKFIYTEEFQQYNFSPSHPLQPVRLKLTYELLKSYGVFETSQLKIVSGRKASDDELLLVHAPEYIDAVKQIGISGNESELSYSFGIGFGDNPAFKGIHDASSLIAGSSILAADLVMTGEADHAINIAGGLHHALKNRASGFCVYNDAACAIAHASKSYGIKVVYIDIDAHHGDGVQWAFYDRSDVLTISLHESGRYLFPGTGFVDEIGQGEGQGFSVNVPLEAGTGDGLFVRAFSEIVPPIVRAFKPDLIVSQNGCDTHYTDPLAQLNLTTNAYETLYSMIHELAHEVCDGKLVVLGGGGYQLYQVVPRAWSLLSAGLAGIALDDYTPGSWQELCFDLVHSQCPIRLRDRATAVPISYVESIDKKTDDIISNVQQKIFPYYDL